MNFIKEYDVVVTGGGIAGVSAAVTSARKGMRTALIEKTIFAGGLATSGLIYIYLPLCDGNGTQVTFGLAEELLKKSILYGPGNIPSNWANEKNADEERRYHLRFSPASFILALDEIMEKSGVDIWYDTLVTDSSVINNTLKSIEVCNKSGKGVIQAKCFIDATGDADLAHYSGLNCPVGDNALALWAIEHHDVDTSSQSMFGCSTYMYFGGKSTDSTLGQPGINGKQVSEFVWKGREKYRNRLIKSYTAGDQDRTSHFPITLPSMAQFRMTRRINGRFTLTNDMEWTRFDDSIGLVADWRKPGSVWEVPFRTLLPVDIKGLIAAGRCIAAEGEAWEVLRVIPAAALTGEAAGTAAVLSIKEKISPDELDYRSLQKELTKDRKFPIHIEDVGL